MPLSDKELQMLDLPDVPDEDLDRWIELFFEKFHPQEEHEGEETKDA